MHIKNISYISFLLLINCCNNLCIAETYSCRRNNIIVYTDKYSSTCYKEILPNIIIKKNKFNKSSHYNNINLKNDLNKLSNINNQNRYEILTNELINEKRALNKAIRLLLNNISILHNKNEIYNEINERKHNIYLLKKEIAKIKD